MTTKKKPVETMTPEEIKAEHRQSLARVRERAGTYIMGEWRWAMPPLRVVQRENDVEASYYRDFGSRMLFNTLWFYEEKNDTLVIEHCPEC